MARAGKTGSEKWQRWHDARGTSKAAKRRAAMKTDQYWKDQGSPF